MSMQINDLGLSIIKSFEGCKLVVYKDAAGLATVGYGHRTGLPVGEPITQDQANLLLAGDINKFESGVSSLLKREADSNQFSALVCFSFNVGLGSVKLGIPGLATSTLLNCFNLGHPADAAPEFLKWCHAGGRVLEGLVARREAEKALFTGDVVKVREILAARG